MSSFLNSMISTTARGLQDSEGYVTNTLVAHPAPERLGNHATAIAGFSQYRRTARPPCYPATYKSLNVFVRGRKGVSIGGTTYLVRRIDILLSSIDVPIVSQIVAASERVPFLSWLLKLAMSMVLEILQSRRNSNHAMVHRKLVAS